MSAQRIGFVGLGAMGRFMARNLARHIHSIGLPPLTVYNRTRSKCEDLQKDVGIDSISVANSLGEVARSCDVIMTNLANDSVVKAVYSEFKQALTGFKFERNKTFVETSTCYPTFLEDLEAFMDELPLTNLIASPVFGAPAAADKAQLVIVMAGDQRVKGELANLLVPSMGRKVIDVGGSIRKAPTLKLIGNSVVIGCLEVISEALTLGEKAGIDVFAIVGVLKDLFPNTPIASYAEIIANNAFDGNKTFAIDNGLKDAGHIRSLAAEYNSPMPAIDLAHQHMLTARALHTAQKAEGTQKFDVLSFAALVAGPRAAAGLNGLDSSEDIKVEKEK